MGYNNKIDVSKLDKIIKKTIDAVDKSKDEMYEFAENARNEVKRLEKELEQLKLQVKEVIESVKINEIKLKEQKTRLMLVSKNFDKYSQEELKKAYEDADNTRVELAIKREQEQNLLSRRNELEFRLKEAMKTVEKAENLMSNMMVALNFLKGDLSEVTNHIEDLSQRQLIGFKIIKAQEEERKRVARDIHDGPAQSMSNVVLKAEICERLIDIDLDKAREELKVLKNVVRNSLQDVRRIIYDLRPMSLDDLGLVPTLQRYILTYKDETGKNVEFNTRGVYEEIRNEIALTVFRIVQEALSNINKHAEAENIVVNLEFINDKLNLYIYDDGKGFDVDELKNKKADLNGGFGLFGIRERVELLNGEFTITSKKGQGTRILAKIPLLQEEVRADE